MPEDGRGLTEWNPLSLAGISGLLATDPSDRLEPTIDSIEKPILGLLTAAVDVADGDTEWPERTCLAGPSTPADGAIPPPSDPECGRLEAPLVANSLLRFTAKFIRWWLASTEAILSQGRSSADANGAQSTDASTVIISTEN